MIYYTVNDDLKSYVDALKSLEKTGQVLNTTYESIFNVTVNGVNYGRDRSSINILGSLSCPSGTISNDGGCGKLI